MTTIIDHIQSFCSRQQDTTGKTIISCTNTRTHRVLKMVFFLRVTSLTYTKLYGFILIYSEDFYIICLFLYFIHFILKNIVLFFFRLAFLFYGKYIYIIHISKIPSPAKTFDSNVPTK